MKISPARIAAFESLRDIASKGASSSDLLSGIQNHLSGKDAALCREIVLGVLRREMHIDAMIRVYADTRRFDLEVLTALRIGVFQILFLDKVPHYAAVGESVELVKRFRKASAARLVNAVLRKFLDGMPNLEYSDDIERISIESSHPRWLIEKWICDHGVETAEKIAAANNERPVVAFRMLHHFSEKTLERRIRSQVVNGCYLAEGFDDELVNWMREGKIYVQDEASQLVGSLIDLPEGSRFLDLCAAPGGKTGLIALSNLGRKNLIVASDVSRRRMAALRESLKLQRAEGVMPVQLDGIAGIPFASSTFDRILVDAPCTGTGTIRHNPEIRYRLLPESPARLKSKQLKLLERSSKLLREGGKLFYSTCSLEPEENEEVCKEFLASNEYFEIVIPDIAPKSLLSGKFLRTWPHRDNMDGFFLAVFRRR